MKQHTKLQHQAEQAQAGAHFQQGRERVASAQAEEFATVDDLLRHDSEQNPVPPEVAERLNRSLAAEPQRERPWYKRFFG